MQLGIGTLIDQMGMSIIDTVFHVLLCSQRGKDRKNNSLFSSPSICRLIFGCIKKVRIMK